MARSVLARRLHGEVSLSIVAIGRSSLTAAELAAMRQQSIEKLPTPLRPQFLKHSDEQSLAALDAVKNAIGEFTLGDYGDWAIISASRHLGRAAFAAVIAKYQVDGPWGVSVQVIPHSSPHAVAGTLSLALNCHGPCIGAGFAPGDELQAMLSLAAFVQRPGIGGAWFVSSGFTDSGQRCTAAALAIVNAGNHRFGDAIGHIHIDNRTSGTTAWQATVQDVPFADFLTADEPQALTWRGANGGLAISVELQRNRLAIACS